MEESKEPVTSDETPSTETAPETAPETADCTESPSCCTTPAEPCEFQPGDNVRLKATAGVKLTLLVSDVPAEQVCGGWSVPCLSSNVNGDFRQLTFHSSLLEKRD